jgi:hypothetical protein
MQRLYVSGIWITSKVERSDVRRGFVQVTAGGMLSHVLRPDVIRGEEVTGGAALETQAAVAICRVEQLWAG